MILLPGHRGKNAIRMTQYNATSFWLLVGKPTAWDDDTHPPNPDPNATAIDGLICAVKANLINVIEDSDAGTFLYTDAFDVVRKFRQINTIDGVRSEEH